LEFQDIRTDGKCITKTLFNETQQSLLMNFQNIIPAKAMVLFVKKNWLFGNSKTICPLQFGVVHLSFKAHAKPIYNN